MAAKSEQTLRKAIEEMAKADMPGAVNPQLAKQQAAEKAWLSVVEATDEALARHQIVVEGGGKGHAQRKTHLETTFDQPHLSNEYSRFADRLHGDCFYLHDCPPDPVMRDLLDRVKRFVDEAAKL